MPSANLRNRMKYALAQGAAADELMGIVGGVYAFSTHLYVDAENGNDTVHDGQSADRAFATMTKALSVVADNGVIHLRGPVFENCTAPNDVTGVTIIGDGSGLRHGSLSNDSEGPSPAWRTASGVTDEPLLQISTQGWTIADILFAPGSADTAIELLSDGGSTPEQTVSGTRILGCRFAQGKWAIQDTGGTGYVTVAGNHFDGQTTASIIETGSPPLPLQWRVLDNFFGGGSATHIDAAASRWEIKGNTFATVAASALYIDLTGGANNVVTDNLLGGTYDQNDYVSGTSDIWARNYGAAGLLSDVPPTTA